MNRDDCRQQILDLLQAQTDAVALAVDYLQGIKAAIADNSFENLDRMVANPELPFNDFEQFENRRHQLLKDFGFSEDSEGFESCVTWCDSKDQLVSKHYKDLVEQLVELQHAIQLNHLLVSKGKDRVKRSIGILTGLNTANQSKTYSSNGQAQETGVRRDIAIA